MKLRDLIPEEDIESAVGQIVERLLDQEVKVTIEGETIGTFIHKVYVCDQCGQDDFQTSQALGGHRWHKHGIKADA